MAPLEFALALPLLATIMLVLLTVLAAAGAAARATYAVRRLAWADSNAEAETTLDAPVDYQMLAAWRPVLILFPELGGPAALNPPSLYEASCNLHDAVAPIQKGAMQATRTLELLHGTWDWRDIPFAQHERLCFGNRVIPLLVTGIDQESFEPSAFVTLHPAEHR
jgi:hypothetical protein